MQYKFKGGEEEDKKPIEERQIVKEGFVSEFSLVGMKRDFMNYAKTLKELRGNRDLKAQTMANIEQHHPFVKDIPEFDRYTVHMYQEAAASFKAFDKKIQEIEAEETEYKAELEEIQKQIPELAPIVSPYMNQVEPGADEAEKPKSTEMDVGAVKPEEAGASEEKKVEGEGEAAK